jgi:hypothetical protein
MKNDNVKCKKLYLQNLPVFSQTDGKNTNGKCVKAVFLNFYLSFLFLHFDI